MDATPLLKEESDFLATTRLQNLLDPFLLHWPGAVPALTAYDRPIDAGNIENAQIFDSRSRYSWQLQITHRKPPITYDRQLDALGLRRHTGFEDSRQ